MKRLLCIALTIISVTADVSHLFKDDGYNYQKPSGGYDYPKPEVPFTLPPQTTPPPVTYLPPVTQPPTPPQNTYLPPITTPQPVSTYV
ncbi:hypothetical protein ACKWTF_005981 [Chironomus riparius]